MKTVFIVAGFVSLFLLQTAFAEDDCVGVREPDTQNYYGDTTCRGVTIKNINVVGSLNTEQGANMKGTSILTGTLSSKNTFFDNVQIHNNYFQGEVWLKNGSIIKGSLAFKGQSGTVCMDNSSMVVGGIVNGSVHCYTA